MVLNQTLPFSLTMAPAAEGKLQKSVDAGKCQCWRAGNHRTEHTVARANLVKINQTITLQVVQDIFY